ncbi:MAG: thioredoxin domain-containing protein [Alphaproteobacteria bacterium]|nr:thioredoxin domain-containing protein [Alphaproteobacteria bacterium]
MNRKYMIYGLVGLAAVLVVVAGYFMLSGNGGDEEVPSTTSRIEIGPNEHTLGDPKAPIQIVEYGAPVCPHCSHFNETVFPLLKKEYIDTGKVYYVFRVFPLHSADTAVEGMASCLPKDSYFQFLDLMFRNQPRWDPEYQVQDVHAGLIAMGRLAGMSEAQVDSCIAKPDIAALVQKNGQEAMGTYGINSVPSFIVNATVAPRSVVEWANLKTYLDSILANQKK